MGMRDVLGYPSILPAYYISCPEVIDSGALGEAALTEKLIEKSSSGVVLVKTGHFDKESLGLENVQSNVLKNQNWMLRLAQ